MVTELSKLSKESTAASDPDPDVSKFNITGHQILVRPVHVESTTKGGIILASKTHEDLSYLMNVCKVLKLGPRAYVQEMFEETGPWCKVGDYVLLPKLAGQKIKFKGVPLTMIGCDKVLAVIEDPKDIDPNYNIGL